MHLKWFVWDFRLLYGSTQLVFDLSGYAANYWRRADDVFGIAPGSGIPGWVGLGKHSASVTNVRSSRSPRNLGLLDFLLNQLSSIISAVAETGTKAWSIACCDRCAYTEVSC